MLALLILLNFLWSDTESSAATIDVELVESVADKIAAILIAIKIAAILPKLRVLLKYQSTCYLQPTLKYVAQPILILLASTFWFLRLFQKQNLFLTFEYAQCHFSKCTVY